MKQSRNSNPRRSSARLAGLKPDDEPSPFLGSRGKLTSEQYAERRDHTTKLEVENLKASEAFQHHQEKKRQSKKRAGMMKWSAFVCAGMLLLLVSTLIMNLKTDLKTFSSVIYEGLIDLQSQPLSLHYPLTFLDKMAKDHAAVRCQGWKPTDYAKAMKIILLLKPILSLPCENIIPWQLEWLWSCFLWWMDAVTCISSSQFCITRADIRSWLR